jgi:hypothetical protein
MYLLLEKLQVTTFSRTRENGDTCLGEEMSWCTRHKGTRCTQHNLQIKFAIHKHIAFINTHEKKYACNMRLKHYKDT